MANAAVGRPMEILLVEDNLLDARMAIAALAGSGLKHRLTLVRDGEEALEFLRRMGRFARAPRPDLMLLDLELPKKDGRELLADLRADYELKTIPVVVLTSSDEPADMEQARVLEVQSFMTKPVDFDKFLAVVRELKRYWLHDLILPGIEV